MKKRILALLLAGVLLALPACSQNPDSDQKDTGKSDSSAADTSTDSSADTSADTEADSIDFGYIEDGLPESYDYNGAAYRVGLLGYEGPLSSVASEELTSDAVNASMYNTTRAVEDRFSCTIENYSVAENAEGLLNTIRTLAQSGDDYYSIYADGALTLSQAFTDGVYYNLYDVPHLDFSQPWWTSGMEELSVADRAYLGVSWLQYDNMNGSYVLFVNKDVAERYDIEVPYEDVFNGTWTIDKLYTLASQSTGELNGNGEWDEDDAYGFTYQEGFTKQLQCSLGVHLVAKDADNRPVSNLDAEAAITYLSFMEKLTEFTCKTPKGTDFMLYFYKGNILFCCSPFSTVYGLLDTDMSYGFLPIPKLDESQEEYETYSHSPAWVIPTTSVGNIEFIGMISEALNAVHFNEVRPAYFETTMKGRLSESPEDAQVLDIVSRSLYADFGFEFSQTITPIWQVRDLFDNDDGNADTSDSIVSTYKSIEKKLNSYIDKMFLGKFDKMVAAEGK